MKPLPPICSITILPVILLSVIFPAPLTSAIPSDPPPATKHVEGTYLGYGFFLPHVELPRGSMVMKHHEKLRLTGEQKAAVHEEMLEYEKFYIRRSADIKISQLEIIHLLHSPQPDAGKIATMIRSLGKMKVDLVIRNFQYRLAIRKILTPEQRKYFRDLPAH